MIKVIKSRIWNHQSLINKNCKKLFSTILINNGNKRIITSNECRQTFIDYFIDNYQHEFIRSSSVRPLQNDQSLLFVNAGMNQFKSIFLDDEKNIDKKLKKLRRVVNSQKCIRVGGKHCDLETVGTDFTHHTFFEMLGNWSFNDYFKQDSCQMAWNLLTRSFRIDPKRLFVTIFAGNEQLELDSDFETYEIWRSIGVPKNRIIPLGMKDNFWEMGQTGPCGICTEIYYLQNNDDTIDIKKYLLNNSMEIWNIVFIQYFRDKNGNLKRLDKNFVDTGMGLERILSILQNVSNNYQTDLFQPYFQRLHNLCKWPEYSGCLIDEKDIAYRIIADHSRMIAIAIADNIEPSDRGAGYLLRRVIRRTIDSIKTMTQIQSLPANVTENDVLFIAIDTTVQILGQTYPELEQRLSKIFEIINNELYLYQTAITRNTMIMKFAKLLQIKINENCQNNEQQILNRIDKINKTINQIQIENLSKNFLQNQSIIDNLRKDLQYLQELLFANDLSRRFGLLNDRIEKNFSEIETKLIELENKSDEIYKQIIEQFQFETKKQMIQGLNYRIIPLINLKFLPYFDLNVKNFLMKISLDIYGENPLAMIIFDQNNTAHVQLSVPSKFQSIKINAKLWFEMAINELNIDYQLIPTKRMKKISKYQIASSINNNWNEKIFINNLNKIGEKYF